MFSWETKWAKHRGVDKFLHIHDDFLIILADYIITLAYFKSKEYNLRSSQGWDGGKWRWEWARRNELQSTVGMGKNKDHITQKHGYGDEQGLDSWSNVTAQPLRNPEKLFGNFHNPLLTNVPSVYFPSLVVTENLVFLIFDQLGALEYCPTFEDYDKIKVRNTENTELIILSHLGSP